MFVVVLDIRSEQARILVVLRLTMVMALGPHIYINTPMARLTHLRVTAHSLREQSDTEGKCVEGIPKCSPRSTAALHTTVRYSLSPRLINSDQRSLAQFMVPFDSWGGG